MKSIILVCCSALALTACEPPATVSTTPVASLPGASTVCTALESSAFDKALQAYGAATDAVNLLINVKAVVPGTPRASAIANANDKVLAGFAAAETARSACNATSYTAALAQAGAGIAEIRAALRK